MFFSSKNFSLDNDVYVSCLNKKFSAELPKTNYCYPKRVDNRDLCLPTNDQKTTPHCVGYSVAGYLEVEFWKQYHYPLQFPAARIYNKAKQIENNFDIGTTIELGFEAAKKLNLFSGDVKTFEGYTTNVKFNLHKYGIFCGAFLITDEWKSVSNRTGFIKEKRKYQVLGGHAVLVCGYNEDGIYIQNSWGYQNWGKYGFAILPWSMVSRQLCYGVVIDNIHVTKLN